MPRLKLTLFVLLALSAGTLFAQPIPDRPEKLVFPKLDYQPPNPADYRVELKSGPVAYVVPDRELPLINISIGIKTGSYLVPKGAEGLASMTGYLLTKAGTKNWPADDLDEHVAFLAARLSSSIGDTTGNVNLNLLSKDLDEGLKILREVLTQPSFEEAKIILRKDQIIQSMKQRNDNPAGIERRERYRLAYGEDFFRSRQSTKDSIVSITQEDLKKFHRSWFVPQNFVISVNGDFEREDMIAKLEKLFANWPFTGKTPPAIPSEYTMAKPGIYIVEKDIPQGRVNVLMPGLTRDDPDYFASQVMNDILGGGGFTSRIMNRVRSDEGLAYSAGSALQGGIYYPQYFIAGFQSKSATVTYATSIVMEEFERIATEEVSDEELSTTKKSYIQTFPEAFATKSQVASRFANDELSGRYAKHPDYWKTYRDRLSKITKADVQRVAKRFVKLKRAIILFVGNKDEILKGHPDHPVNISDLSAGPIIDLPLRDPLTLKPIEQ